MVEEGNTSPAPELERAQHALREALNDACKVDVRTADTGELIRVEESLEAAARAAKDAVSLRLKRRSDRQAKAAEVSAEAPAERASESHRILDVGGIPWAVFGVYPSHRSVEQGTLPERFNSGWLSFEHGDEVRRYAPVPANWESLTDVALRALWEKADVSTKRITTLQTAEDKLPPPPTE